MGPNTYVPPSQPQPQPDPSNQWFNSLPNQDLPPPKQSFPKKPLIISAAVILLLGSVLAVLLISQAAAAKCLTTDDYAVLSGEKFQDTSTFSPTDSFYTSTMTFGNGSSDISDEDKAALKDIADFYAARAEQNKSIIITVGGGYTKNDSQDAASERVSKAVDQLTSAGVNESNIVRSEIERIETGSELSDDSMELKNATLYVSITSDTSCR